MKLSPDTQFISYSKKTLFSDAVLNLDANTTAGLLKQTVSTMQR